MKGNPLRLAEGRVLVEQLRLLMGNVGTSVIPGILLALLMLWVLSNDANAPLMRLWCAGTILSKLGNWFHARRHLASGIPFDMAPRLVWMLILLNAVDGAIWGSLGWVALDTASMAGSILVVSVLAGVAGNSMALLSPVLPVFIAFLIPEVGALVWKVLLMGDPAYNALGVAGILYVATLLEQARNSARAARTAIELRFENIELLDQLRVKTEIAETAQREAEHARHEAEQANASKSKFLAAASHDLRQPIHAQGLFLEVLARTELTAQQRELLASTCAASDASAEMLNTLLDFSRIEAGVVEPCIQPFRLQPLFNKIEREFEQQADAKGLAYRSRETALVVQSDPALIELILRNLASNAIRYTERGGLLVACRKRGDQAVLEVWDTGIGITPAHQQEVFREFHQLGNPERDRRKGLGLGLAIADGLARTLGHGLTLASTPQRGSVFRLSLPIASGLPVAEHGLTVRKNKAQKLNVCVLVIDDDETVRTGMLHLLRDWGCECAAAGSIEEALALARTHAPDVVISDYRLREQRTGLEAIAALRELLGEALPALLITGDTAPDRLREAQSSGTPLLHKPVSPGQLYRRLVEVLETDARR
jgi:signal transduction histidine kinase/CheY-like chemotaxis protein